MGPPNYAVVSWRDGYWWRVAVIDVPGAIGRVHLAADIEDEARALIVERLGVQYPFAIVVKRLRHSNGPAVE